MVLQWFNVVLIAIGIYVAVDGVASVLVKHDVPLECLGLDGLFQVGHFRIQSGPQCVSRGTVWCSNDAPGCKGWMAIWV